MHAGHSAFGLHVCVCLIKQAAYERSPLLSSLSLLFLIYCNVGLRGREPGHDLLTHLTRLEDETYPSTVCTQGALLHAKCHDWYASSVKACVRSGACSVFISHVFPMHLPHLGALLSVQAFISLLLCQAAAHAHLVIVVLN